MDFVRSNDETAIHLILGPTFEAFASELEKHKEEIESVERKTFKYGDTDRHQLDVYYPTNATAKKPPILIFVYGGGYFSGDRVYPSPFQLVYKNLGAFFAKRGFLTVIPDYRLHPHVKYPSPSEDVRDALAYVVDNLGDAGDLNNLFMTAHSAGGAILATALLHPTLITEGKSAGRDLRKNIKAVNLMAGAYTYEGPPGAAPPGFVEDFFGSDSNEKVPLGLLKSTPQSVIESLPPLFLTKSEKDADPLIYCHEAFLSLLQERLGKNVDTGIVEGHNHISPHLALSTGDGESWAEEVIAWFNKQK